MPGSPYIPQAVVPYITAIQGKETHDIFSYFATSVLIHLAYGMENSGIDITKENIIHAIETQGAELTVDGLAGEIVNELKKIRMHNHTHFRSMMTGAVAILSAA